MERITPRISGYVALVLSLFSIAVPLLYLVGYLNISGYLKSYSLTIDAFSLPTEQIIIQAYYLLLNGLISILNYVLNNLCSVGLYALFIVAISSFLFWINLKAEKKESTQESKRVSPQGDEAADGPIVVQRNIWSSGKLFVIYVLLMNFICIVLPIILLSIVISGGLLIWNAHENGFLYGQNEIDEFISCGKPDSDCVFIFKGDEKILEGGLIRFSHRYLAVYDGERAHLLPNDGLRIETQPRK